MCLPFTPLPSSQSIFFKLIFLAVAQVIASSIVLNKSGKSRHFYHAWDLKRCKRSYQKPILAGN